MQYEPKSHAVSLALLKSDAVSMKSTEKVVPTIINGQFDILILIAYATRGLIFGMSLSFMFLL